MRERFEKLRCRGRALSDPAAIKRLLLRAPNWLGDAVMGLPMLAGLREIFTQARLTVLALPRVAPLFAGQPEVAEIIPYPGGREKWRFLWRLRGQFDLGVLLPNSLESALGLWLGGVSRRAGYCADARRPFLTLAVNGRDRLAGCHLVYYYLGILRAFGKVQHFTPPRLFLKPGETEAAGELLETLGLTPGRPLVGISPGAAYGPAKRWPPERFAAVARRLQNELGVGLVILGGPDDREAAALVKGPLGRRIVDLVGKTDLRQALGVLSRLSLLITNDSGLMHAAAALGVPLVALFGSTNPDATGPFSHRAVVLRRPLPCAPCLQRTCPEDYQCLTALSVEETATAARRLLAQGP